MSDDKSESKETSKEADRRQSDRDPPAPSTVDKCLISPLGADED